MEYNYTKHQIPRGARPDGENYDKLFLLKNVSALRLTYQIRLLALRAVELKRRLVIQVPKACRVHPSLQNFITEHAQAVRIEKV